MELLELRSRVEELKCTRQEAERQLLILQEQYRQQVNCLEQDQREDANTRETLDRRLADLRSEVIICSISGHPTHKEMAN